jgi:hydroxymethylpyrimidine pyrophosphatase-like HAD family hydrolase
VTRRPGQISSDGDSVTNTVDLRGWVAATARRPGLLRLVLLDVDGCLTQGEGSTLDLPVFQLVAALNRRALDEPDLPAVTLCTGRPEPYVELLGQAIGGFVPAIWESGAGIYVPSEYRFLAHPLLTAERLDALAEIRQVIHRRIVRAGVGYPQIGKEFSVSCYPMPGVSLDSLYAELAEALGPYSAHYTVHHQRTCVEALPNGIDKGSGARWLAELIGLPLDQMAGVGDQTADLTFLAIVGAATAPSNATADVRAAAHFVAPNPCSRGLVDILNWIVARNRAGAPARGEQGQR